ncbi:GNAT family N-acetyltransferase [Corallococcus sp. H22C18031201]|uniref:GNAT family N-acetyltransferase n=1 Tax=Citreicoccus inhibens TaxID=2849499 RepID=UPI000E70DAC2|nr:GNAT family N-acetyltransferase [Citreicoccus inhibens]MBU8898647.1 GNAT family N-acetyltransferase [Citreicoccus inhibens]RJS15986.1 GNAT family N-acetyltransferase [Corallococcus sp. H22C18031201]
MHIREAAVEDIPELMRVRWAVRENRLSHPARVPPEMVHDYIIHRGRGWVCEHEGRVAGFSIADQETASIWALFIDPPYEGQGIAQALLAQATAWLFAGGASRIVLSTAPGTRAERFYARAGWERTGLTSDGEMGFALDVPSSRSA